MAPDAPKSPRRKVQVWIYTRQPAPQVLILKTNAKRGAFWQPVTGGVEEGEALERAALREATEETGLSFIGGPRPLGEPFRFPSQWDGALCEEQAFSLEVAQPAKPNLDPKEHDAYQWLDPRQALSMIRFESNQQMLKLLLDQLGL